MGPQILSAAAVAMIALMNPEAGVSVPPRVEEGMRAEGAVRAEYGPEYRVGERPWKVRTVERLVLRDEGRGKDLEVMVRGPAVERGLEQGGEAPAFPLVIFSHGMGGSKAAFGELCELLAAHGYVVVSPTHEDSLGLRRRRGGVGERGSGGAADGPLSWSATRHSLISLEARLGRVDDLKFLIDSADRLEAAIGARIDRERVAVAGHSAGAYTSQLISGVTLRTRERPGGTTSSDDRVRAAVLISPQGVNGAGFTERAWETVTIPTLSITGSEDVARVSDQTPETRQDPFRRAKGREAGGPAAYLLWLERATHSAFQGTGVRDPQDRRMFVAATNAATLAFLDAWVKGDERAMAYIESNTITGLSIAEGDVRFERK